MKAIKSSSQVPSLSDLIEIIRDPQQPSSSDQSLPPEIDDSNPFYALTQLVEKLESIIGDDSEQRTTQADLRVQDQEHATTRASDIECYIDIFQKQRAMLRKVMSKLN
jgi:hypothetical protein